MDGYLLPLTSALLTERTERPVHKRSDQSKAMIIRMLADEFHVDEILINALQPQGFTYLEVRRILSISRQMPGSINHDNVRKVMEMRCEGGHKKAWIEIVRELGVALDHRTSRAEGPAAGTP